MCLISQLEANGTLYYLTSRPLKVLKLFITTTGVTPESLTASKDNMEYRIETFTSSS